MEKEKNQKKNKPDLRLQDYIHESPFQDPAVCLIGFPSDQGVKINNGRPGASKAPDLIYEQLLKLTPHAGHFEKHTNLLFKTTGLEEIVCTDNVEDDQERLGDHIAKVFGKFSIPVIIAGGHETSFGHFLGYAKAGKSATILNIDAHADVRPLKDGQAHSGSPFFQALEHSSGLCKSYTVFGLNPASVAKEHIDYVNKNGNADFEENLSLKPVQKFLKKNSGNNILATMDMDVVRQADAPGVSAPNSSGISKKLWLEIAFELGKTPAVTSFDLCEVNPEYDRDQQTVKLAALTIWYFLLGVALRSRAQGSGSKAQG